MKVLKKAVCIKIRMLSMKSLKNAKRNEKSTCNMNSDFGSLSNLRSKTANGLIFGYLNINSIRNKFEFIKPVAKS